jgi:hypothetical protein
MNGWMDGWMETWRDDMEYVTCIPVPVDVLNHVRLPVSDGNMRRL